MPAPFFEKVGKLALGSRLRLLTERITEDAAQIYQLYNINLQPKWFPVFYVLSAGEPTTVTALAREIGHSHASVSKIISEMLAAGLLKEKKDKQDGRRNLVTLSARGREMVSAIQDQYADVNSAIEEAAANTRHDLWKAIAEWEYLLEQQPLLRRVQEQKKKRESSQLQIVDYTPEYQHAFRQLNEEWISHWFTMEAADYKALDNPQGYILDKGGAILVALLNNQPVGVCALIKMHDGMYDFELAKMAVAPAARGKNIGYLLGKAIIEKAKALGAQQLYLESNTVLAPAIRLYQKLGFTKVAGHPTPYERCNIQMALRLDQP